MKKTIKKSGIILGMFLLFAFSAYSQPFIYISPISEPDPVCENQVPNLILPTITDNGLPITSQGWMLDDIPYNSTPLTFADNGKKLTYVVESGVTVISSNEVSVTVKKAPELGTLATPAPICAGGSLALIEPIINWNNGTTETKSWHWADGTALDPTIYIGNVIDDGKEIFFQVENECGAPVVSNRVPVAIGVIPEFNVSASATDICEG